MTHVDSHITTAQGLKNSFDTVSIETM